MKKIEMKQIISFIGITSMAMVIGAMNVSAQEEKVEDSAESNVEILVKEEPNVGEKLFKFDSVPTGFSFIGDATKVNSNKLAMKGTTEGLIANIGLKTDIDNADQSNFKVTGTMKSVTRKSDRKSFAVDSFTMKFDKRDVDVKSGNASIMDKGTISKKDQNSSDFYDYLYSNDVTESNLVIAVDNSLEKGDEFSGKLIYTLSGTIEFS